MHKIQQMANGGNACAEGDYSEAEGGAAGDSTLGPGGDGGDALAVGMRSKAVGGNGGGGGIGKGGAGMHVEVYQDDAISLGGHGGESNQHDGRGGRGGTAPLLDYFGQEYLRRARMKLPYGAPNIYVGRGGDTPDTPQYKARRIIVERLKGRYYTDKKIEFVEHDIWYDRTNVPLDWLNLELGNAGHLWRAAIEDDEYRFLDQS